MNSAIFIMKQLWQTWTDFNNFSTAATGINDW